MANQLQKVGEYSGQYNDVLKLELPTVSIYVSDGLKKHMLKRGHSNCEKYIENIPDIISTPDYIGKNPKEPNSIELVKVYTDDNVQIGIKLDISENYLYVATMFEVKQAKIERRLNSGRLVKAIDKLSS